MKRESDKGSEDDDFLEVADDDRKLLSQEAVEEIALDHVGEGEIIEIESEIEEGKVSYQIRIETEDDLIDLEIDANEGTVEEIDYEEEEEVVEIEEDEEDEILGEDEMEFEDEEHDLDENENRSLYGDGDDEDRSPIGMILVIGIVGILIVATVGAIFFMRDGWDEGRDEENGDDDGTEDPFDDFGSNDPSNDPLEASISEVNPSGEWFEIYIWGDGPASTEGWKFTTFDEQPVDMETVSGLNKYSFITVITGSGIDDLDGSDGTAEIHLGIDGDILSDDGDEIAIFDGDDNIIDFIGWGIGSNDTAREGWTKQDYAALPDAGESISLHGPDLDADSNWISSIPSPGSNNILEVDLSPVDDWTAHIINGRSRKIDIDEFGEDFRYLDINISIGIPAGHAVDQDILDNVTENINFTYNLLKDMGFGDAMASGTDSEGDPFVNITVTAGGTYSGGCDSSGNIEVDIGNNRPASKQTIEHEMTHNFQFAKRVDGSSHINPWNNNFIDEGTAEFIGRYSAMKNYNLTWQEIEEELDSAGSMNIYDYFHLSWFDIFTDWPQSYNRTYTRPYGDYYGGSFLFMKFLSDKFGIEIVAQIYNTVTNHPGHANDTTGTDAIEEATGEDFDDLVAEFNLYRLENRFPQYKNDTEFQNTTVDNEVEFNGTGSITDTESVEQYGSRINRYHLNGSSATVDFEPRTNRSRWQLTVIRIRDDGTREYETIRLAKDENGFIYIPEGYEQVIIIKTRLNGSLYFIERFNITIDQAPVITPTGPLDNDHIMWDPDPGYLEWMLENLTEKMEVDLRIDNTSTFAHPHYNWTLPWNTTSLPLPEDIQNGTWWWKLRWRTDDIFGPWTEPQNFTIWRGMPRPEIMWDPEPYRFENGSGSWQLLIPDMEIGIMPVEIPLEVDAGQGYGELRFGGPDNLSGILRLNPGVPVSLPELGEEFNYMEWRIATENYSDTPWFRDDIMWDPAPPSLELLKPFLPERTDENQTVHVGVNDSYHVNSFFDVFYELESGGKKQYTRNASFNRSLDDIIVFDLELNITELPEGTVIFTMNVSDEHGRTSNMIQFEIEIDRTAPGVTWDLFPHRENMTYNGTFQVNLTVEDETVSHIQCELMDSNMTAHQFEMWYVGPAGEGFLWTGTVDLISMGASQGPATIHVTVFDDLGHTSGTGFEIVVDTVPPEISILSPAEGEMILPGETFFTSIEIFEEHMIETVYVWVLHVPEVGGMMLFENVTMIRTDPSIYRAEINVGMEWIPGTYYLWFNAFDTGYNHAESRLELALSPI